MKTAIKTTFQATLLITLLLLSSTLPISTSEQTTDETEYWALLVAVGVYADNPGEDRPLMLEEVDDLYDLMIQSPTWDEDHIKVIKGRDATILNILKGLRWLDRQEDSNDISLFYITTHGFPLGVDIFPQDEEDQTDEGLATYWGFAYTNFVLWDDQLNFMLNRLESQGVCFIVDSCYAGGFNDPPNALPTDEIQMSQQEWMDGFSEEMKTQGRVILMASCEDEVSYSGGYAPYLIDALRGYADYNGDGVVTAEETFIYTEPRPYRQSPTMYDGYEGELPLIELTDSIIKEQETTQNLPQQHSQQKAEETATMKGYVTDEDTAQPISNAQIEVGGRTNDNDQFENYTTTDSNGFFSINMPAGRYRINVDAEDYYSWRSWGVNVAENETEWVNVSLVAHEPEDAQITGYVLDDDTQQPIQGAEIDVEWNSGNNNYRNGTYTDATGYYSINIAAGEIELDVSAEGYFTKRFEDFDIQAEQTIWKNTSLVSFPPQEAIISGYVTDSQSQQPLEDVRVEAYWVDYELELEYGVETYTDQTGHYSLNITEGEVYMDFRENGYDYYSPYRVDSEDYQTTWYNVSLESEQFQVEIYKPLKAIYLQDQRLTPYPRCIVFGGIEVSAYTEGELYNDFDPERVEFYLDGELMDTVYSQPYNWTWNTFSLGKHMLKVVAYSDDGRTAEDELEVLKLL